jgi:hypothetical protein
MPINLDEIRKKLQKLQGNQRNSDIQMWKPDLGEHRIRVVPWADVKEGQFAHELWFYYIPRQVLALSQFNEDDPVDEFMRALYKTKKDEDRQVANSLRPKMRSFSAVIVRGQEDKGVQVWSYGKLVYQRFLNFLLDPDVGDFTDPKEGFDMKVTLTKQQGKQFNDTSVDPARKPSPLSSDPEQMKKWLETPNIFNMYQKKTYGEVKNILDAYLNPSDVNDEGTSKGKPVADELEDAVSSLSESKAAKPESKKSSETAKPAGSKSLDEAFGELMDEDE